MSKFWNIAIAVIFIVFVGVIVTGCSSTNASGGTNGITSSQVTTPVDTQPSNTTTSDDQAEQKVTPEEITGACDQNTLTKNPAWFRMQSKVINKAGTDRTEATKEYGSKINAYIRTCSGNHAECQAEFEVTQQGKDAMQKINDLEANYRAQMMIYDCEAGRVPDSLLRDNKLQRRYLTPYYGN